jgi:zinc transport system permease protein
VIHGWQHLAGALPFEWAQYAFMQNALLATVLVSVLFGLLGSMVINQQMAFFSDAIGHAALTGIAIGVLLGLGSPLAAMLAFAVLLAVAITQLRRISRASADTVIGLVMAFAVALGVVILSRGGGFSRYSAFLVGDVLSITEGEILRLGLLLLAVAALAVPAFNRVMFVSLNPSLARSRGIPVALVETLFAVAVAVAVTACIQWVGLLVINSMIILPAAAARNLARSMTRYLWLSVAISLAAGVTGLIASYYWATATGATIVLAAMGLFLASLLFQKK